MKWLYAFVAIFLVVNAQEEYCSTNVESSCRGSTDDLDACNATFSGFQSSVEHLQAYTNEQIQKSYEYLLLASNFGNYVKNRPGFAKQFRALSDEAWENAVGLIKHITKRGGEHRFDVQHKKTVSVPKKVRTLELNELEGLAFALDTEKSLALEAHRLHERYSHSNHPSRYDAEIAHYLEEEFIEDQASTVRKLSGYTNDLKRLLDESVDSSLSLFLFDEYLQKQ